MQEELSPPLLPHLRENLGRSPAGVRSQTPRDRTEVVDDRHGLRRIYLRDHELGLAPGGKWNVGTPIRILHLIPDFRNPVEWDYAGLELDVHPRVRHTAHHQAPVARVHRRGSPTPLVSVVHLVVTPTIAIVHVRESDEARGYRTRVRQYSGNVSQVQVRPRPTDQRHVDDLGSLGGVRAGGDQTRVVDRRREPELRGLHRGLTRYEWTTVERQLAHGFAQDLVGIARIRVRLAKQEVLVFNTSVGEALDEPHRFLSLKAHDLERKIDLWKGE